MAIKQIDAGSIHHITSAQVVVDLVSCVKELVENALDANATNIEVKFSKYGLDGLEVVDNGDGIDESDFENVTKKHHTSKIESFDQLELVSTYGFRGEAMSSLCGMCDVTMITCTKAKVPRATRLQFDRAGNLVSQQTSAGKKGTTVTLSNIMAPIPVRRRDFEKNYKREYAKALTMLQEFVIIATHCRITVSNTTASSNSKRSVQFNSATGGSVKNNIRQVYGHNVVDTLVPMSLKIGWSARSIMSKLRNGGGHGDDDDEQDSLMELEGYISKPIFGQGRQSKDKQIFYINSRPCELPQVAKAVNEIYRNYNSTEYPFIVANLNTNTKNYDVNVSPNKRLILLHQQDSLIEKLKEQLTDFFDNSGHAVPESTTVLTQKTPAGPGRQSSLAMFEFSKTPKQERTVRAVVAEEPEPESEPEPEEEPALEEMLVGEPELQQPEEDDELELEPEPESESRQPDQHLDLESSPRPLMHGSDSESERDGVSIEHRRSASHEPHEPHHEDNNDDDDDDDDDETTPVFDVSTDLCPTAPIPDSVEDAIDTTEESLFVEENAYVNDQAILEAPPIASQLPPSSSERTYNSRGDRSRPSSSGSNNSLRKKRKIASVQPIGAKTLEQFAFGATRSADISEEEPEQDQDQDETIPMPMDTSWEGGSEAGSESESEKQPRPQSLDSSVDDDGHYNIDRRVAMLYGRSRQSGTLNQTSKLTYSMQSIKRQLAKRQEFSSETHHMTKSNIQDSDQAEQKLGLTITKKDFKAMKIVGQFNKGFILVTKVDNDRKDLFIVDQHASDEIYNFEDLKNNVKMDNQPLAAPRSLQLTPVDEITVTTHQSTIEKNGFKIAIDEEAIPGSKCKLTSVPISKNTKFDEKDLLELIFKIEQSPQDQNVRCSKVRAMFAMRACRKSIMIGQSLDLTTMSRVVRHLAELEKPWNCPHGRPTLRHLMTIK